MKLPLALNRQSGIPIYVQLEEQIRLLIHTGSLRPGDPLPTVRELAVSMGINYNTIARVYRDLQRMGVLHLKRGIGTFVAEPVQENIASAEDLKALEKIIRRLIPAAKNAGLSKAQLFRFLEIKLKESEYEL